MEWLGVIAAQQLYHSTHQTGWRITNSGKKHGPRGKKSHKKYQLRWINSLIWLAPTRTQQR